MSDNNIAGAIVERDGYQYMIVRSSKNTFTGKPAFGFVDLQTGVYNNLDVGLNTLYDILKKTHVNFVAKGLADYVEDQKARERVSHRHPLY